MPAFGPEASYAHCSSSLQSALPKGLYLCPDRCLRIWRTAIQSRRLTRRSSAASRCKGLKARAFARTVQSLEPRDKILRRSHWAKAVRYLTHAGIDDQCKNSSATRRQTAERHNLLSPSGCCLHWLPREQMCSNNRVLRAHPRWMRLARLASSAWQFVLACIHFSAEQGWRSNAGLTTASAELSSYPLHLAHAPPRLQSRPCRYPNLHEQLQMLSSPLLHREDALHKLWQPKLLLSRPDDLRSSTDDLPSHTNGAPLASLPVPYLACASCMSFHLLPGLQAWKG